MNDKEFAEQMHAELFRLLTATEPVSLDRLPEAEANAQKYFERLMEHFAPIAVTGEYLDLWFGAETTAPDDTRPRENHVRDAVRANR